MFRKKFTFKSKDIVGGRELKAFRERMMEPLTSSEGPLLQQASQFGLDTDVVAKAVELLEGVVFPSGKKAQLAAHKFIATIGTAQTPVVVFVVSDIPLFFEFERPPANADLDHLPVGKPLPTIFFFSCFTQLLLGAFPNAAEDGKAASIDTFTQLLGEALHAAPVLMTCPATQFILENGADLMMPGVQYVPHDDGLKRGSSIGLWVKGNATPVAIGGAGLDLAAGAPGATASGKAVKIYHSYEDLLWKHFVKPYGVALTQRAKAASVKPSDRTTGIVPPGFSPSLVKPDQVVVVALQKAMLSGAAGAAGDDSAAKGQSAAPTQAPSETLDESKQKVLQAFVEEHREEILEYSLCEAIRRIRASMLPIPVNEFMGRWFVPCRPVGVPASALNFKDTVHKKAITFLRKMIEEHDLLEISEAAHATALDAKASGTAAGTTGVFSVDKVNKSVKRMGQHKSKFVDVASTTLADGGKVLYGIADEAAIQKNLGVEENDSPVEAIDNIETLFRPQKNWNPGLMYALFRVGSAPAAAPSAMDAAPSLGEAYGSEDPAPAAEEEPSDDESDDEDAANVGEAAMYRREVEKIGLSGGQIKAHFREYINERKLMNVPSKKDAHVDPESSNGGKKKKGVGFDAKSNRPTVTIDEAFSGLYKRGQAPEACDLEELFQRCINALLPMHRIWYDRSPPQVHKQLPPPVKLIAERRGGNKTVTRIVGLTHYYGELALDELCSILRTKLSTSVTIDDAVAGGQKVVFKSGKKPPRELVVQGNATKTFVNFAAELGLPSNVIEVSIGKGVK